MEESEDMNVDTDSVADRLEDYSKVGGMEVLDSLICLMLF